MSNDMRKLMSISEGVESGGKSWQNDFADMAAQIMAKHNSKRNAEAEQYKAKMQNLPPEPVKSKQELVAELSNLKSEFDPSFEYSDDYSFVSQQRRIRDRINYLTSEIDKLDNTDVTESAPPGMEDLVMKLKKEYPNDHSKAFATAWSIYNKEHGKTEESVMAIPEDEIMTDYDKNFIGSVIRDMYPVATSKEELRSMVAGQTGYGDNPKFDSVFDSELDKILGREDIDFPDDDDNAPDIDNDSEFDGMDDMSADADALASAGHGSDEDYGYADEIYENKPELINPAEVNAMVKLPLDSAKTRAAEIISATNTSPVKKDYLLRQLEKSKSTMSVIKLLYDMILKGEGNGVQGSSYSKKFDKGMEEDIQNGYNDINVANGDDYFPDGADGPVVKAVGPSGARQGDDPEQKQMQVSEVYKELVYGYRNFLKESQTGKGKIKKK